MARTDIILPAEPAAALPAVRSISPADLLDVLAKGRTEFLQHTMRVGNSAGAVGGGFVPDGR